jgi:hypothetical protein
VTRAEVIELVADRMIGRWAHQRHLDSDASLDDYAVTLATVEPEHARAAVDAWYRDGEKFAPNGAQILSKLAELALDPPDWGQVKAAILGWHAPTETAAPVPVSCPHGLCEGDGMIIDLEENTTYRCRCWPERLATKRARRARHPLVAEFLRLTSPHEFDDLEGDRTAEAQIRGKWEAFIRGVRRQITYAGIDSAGLPALERVCEEQAARAQLAGRAMKGRGLRGPDFLRLVGGDAA